MKYRTTYLIFLGLLTFFGCSDKPEDHTRSLGGAFHKTDLTHPDKYCINCHGNDLLGKNTAPSCFHCHADLWNQVDAEEASTTPPTDHIINKNGSKHLGNYFDPTIDCKSCHGSDLKGETSKGPSCFLCHGDVWKRAEHTSGKQGVRHAPNATKPETNCLECHGSDLKGGTNGEPSCYSCHGQVW